MTERKPEDFTKFYFDKVATGEGCGCAERVIDMHEFNRLAGRNRPLARLALPTRAGLRRFLQKAGLTSRPRGPRISTGRHWMRPPRQALD